MRRSLFAAQWCFKPEGKIVCRRWAFQRFCRSSSEDETNDVVEPSNLFAEKETPSLHHMKPSKTESSGPKVFAVWAKATTEKRTALQQELILERLASLQSDHWKVAKMLQEHHEEVVGNMQAQPYKIRQLHDLFMGEMHLTRTLVGTKIEDVTEEVKELCGTVSVLIREKEDKLVETMDANHLEVVEKLEDVFRKMEGLQEEAKEQLQEVVNKLEKRDGQETVKTRRDEPYERVAVDMEKQHEQDAQKIDEVVGKAEDLRENAKEQHQVVNRLKEQHKETVKTMEYQLHENVFVEMWKQHMSVAQTIDEVLRKTEALHEEANEQLVCKLEDLHKEVIQKLNKHNDMELVDNDRPTGDSVLNISIGLFGCSIGFMLGYFLPHILGEFSL